MRVKLLGEPIVEVADRFGMTRNAVDQALHRTNKRIGAGRRVKGYIAKKSLKLRHPGPDYVEFPENPDEDP